MTKISATDPGIALCLSSSYLGFFAHAGFLHELLRTGIRPRYVTGTSTGAYVGSLHAAGMPADEILEFILAPEMIRSFWEWRGPLRGFGMLANLRGFTGLLSGHKAARYLRRALGDRRIEDCTDPELSIAVTNLTQFRSEIVRSGPIVDFVMASCAVPGLFATVEIGDQIYWDGAIANSAPFHHWFDDPRVHTILVHILVHEEELIARRKSSDMRVADAFSLVHQIINHRLDELALQVLEHRGKRVVVMRTIAPRPRFFSRRSQEGNTDAGRATVRHHSKELALVLDGLNLGEAFSKA